MAPTEVLLSDRSLHRVWASLSFVAGSLTLVRMVMTNPEVPYNGPLGRGKTLLMDKLRPL